MKKIIAIVLAIAAVFSFAACGKKAEAPAAEVKAANVEVTPNVKPENKQEEKTNE